MIYAADLFAGSGGTSTGMARACRSLGLDLDLVAINHWDTAIQTHTRNHPWARHHCADISSLDPNKLVPGGRLNLLVASPECTHHSSARGGRPCSDQSRASAWNVLHWAERLQIRNILIENVKEFADWGPLDADLRPIPSRKGETFRAFLAALQSLDYELDYKVLNAADYGDPTTRQRLFVQACKGRKPTWPQKTHEGKWIPARDVIDFDTPSQSIYTRKKELSANTLARIHAGLQKFCGAPFLTVLNGTTAEQLRYTAKSLDQPVPTITTNNHMYLCQPFVLGQQSCSAPRSTEQPLPTIATAGAIGLVQPFISVFYGSNGHPDNRSVDQPLGTVTTKSRFGLVEPLWGRDQVDVRFRMLQPEELARAMGFQGYDFAGNKTEVIKQIGNAVPVGMATALCRTILQTSAER